MHILNFSLDRNGRTGELIEEAFHPPNIPESQRSSRVVRAKLQAALLKEIDQSRVVVGKKLVEVNPLPNGKVKIRFEDGPTDEVDLLVGADGIRSVSSIEPSAIRSNFNTIVRTVLRLSGA